MDQVQFQNYKTKFYLLFSREMFKNILGEKLLERLKNNWMNLEDEKELQIFKKFTVEGRATLLNEISFLAWLFKDSYFIKVVQRFLLYHGCSKCI